MVVVVLVLVLCGRIGSQTVLATWPPKLANWRRAKENLHKLQMRPLDMNAAEMDRIMQ